MKDNFKILSGLIALLVYLILLFLIFYLFGFRSETKPVHYVKKNSEAIAVSLAGTKSNKSDIGKDIKKTSEIKKKKPKPKKIRNITSKKPAPSKSKIAKKPAKKIEAKSLFSDVNTAKNKDMKDKKSKSSKKTASQKVSESLRKPNNSDKGVENRYFAAIQDRLKDWPAQVNYAGELISVRLKIYSSGKFEFKIEKLSSNSEFNEALIAYLKQLQQIGLQKHSRARPYDVLVEFEATE